MQTIAQRKEELANERERKRIEKKLIKDAKKANKQKKKEAKEKRAHEREAKRLQNTIEIVAIEEEAKKQFKAKWTIEACKQARKNLHDFIKKGGGSSNQSPYLEK